MRKTYIIEARRSNGEVLTLWSTSNGYRFVPNGQSGAVWFLAMREAKRTVEALAPVWLGLKLSVKRLNQGDMEQLVHDACMLAAFGEHGQG